VIISPFYDNDMTIYDMNSELLISPV